VEPSLAAAMCAGAPALWDFSRTFLETNEFRDLKKSRLTTASLPTTIGKYIHALALVLSINFYGSFAVLAST